MAERRKLTDDKIYKAAVIEFGINGYANTTLSSIAKSSGISAGLIVQNFGGKEELYSKIASDITGYMHKEFQTYSTTWDIRCVGIVEHFVKMLRNNPFAIHYLNFYVSMLTSKDTPADITKIAYTAYNESPVEKMIKEGQKRGEIINGDPYDIHTLFWVNMNNTICYCFNHGLEFPSTDWFLQIIRRR